MVNRIALRLGVPWIDAGVEPGGWLVRFNLYLNGNNGPCLECSWDEEDYNLLEQRYPCSGAQEHSSFPSSSPSGLGALAASLQALEVERLIATKSLRKEIERQVLLDARHQRCFVTALARQSGCANSPHRPWMIRRLPLASKSSNLADLFNAGGSQSRKTIDGPLSLSMPGHRFTRRVYCPGCGRNKERLRLLRPNSPVDLRCSKCSRKMWAVGRDLANELTNSSLSQQELDRDLYSLGLRDWDVITLRMAGVERHYEIGGKDEKERL
jgi:hypothetical protein